MIIKFIITKILLILLAFQSICFGQDTLRRPKVGLVLSGGGAKGLAHIGVLKVIEESGIPIDYVAGTSMGSVVGGLYSIGYSAKEIENICLKQDWIGLLTDQLNRKNLSVQEKSDFDKYLISFPFQNMKVKLPSGMGAGQNISMLLSRLSISVTAFDNFNEFQRPFLSVATDIVTGKEVVFTMGYLPDAIMASMAIPTIFTPIEIENHLLVDGGLINSLPADHLKEMGADIIIGVNLGLKDYSKEELKNLATVLEQSLFFQAKRRTMKNMKLCDILIRPDVYSSNAASFSNAQGLIAIGEEAGHKKLSELKKLADSLNLNFTQESVQKVKKPDSLFISEYGFEGLDNVTSRFIEGKLRLNLPGKISIKDLESGIERAYGTQFFNKINYKLEKTSPGEFFLTFRVEEKTNNLIRIGARYDSEYKTQLLLNATFRNKFIKGTKLSTDFYLGFYPRINLEYRINTGWVPKKKAYIFKRNQFGILPDFGLRINSRSQAFNYYKETVLLSTYKYNYVTFTAFLSSTISNPFYFESGISYEFSGLKDLINTIENPIENKLIQIYGLLKYDSYDQRAYPRKGALILASTEFFRDLNIENTMLLPVSRNIFQFEKVFTPMNSLSIKPRVAGSVVLGDTISPLQKVFLGGNLPIGKSPVGMFQFVGFRFMEKMDNTLLCGGLKITINILNDHHINFDNNIGQTSVSWEELIKFNSDIYYGYGFSYAYNSIIGPIEAGIYKSNLHEIGWQSYFSIGFYF